MEEGNEKKESSTPSEASAKEQPSENQTPKTLKAKAGLGKKLIRRRLVKKIVLASKKESSNTKIEGSTELNSVEENHEKDITDENQQDESQQEIVLASKKESSNTKIEGSAELNSVEENHEKDIADENQQDESQQGQQKHQVQPSENQTPDSKVEVELGKKPLRRRLVKKIVSASKEESCDTKNEDFTKPNSMEENQGKDITNENQQEEGQMGQRQQEEQPFGNQTSNSLKAKAELGKKPIRRRLRKQIASASKKESRDTQKEDSMKLNPMEEKQGKDSTNKDQEEEGQQAQQKQQEKGELNKRCRDERSNNEGGPSIKSSKKVKRDEKDGATDNRLRNEKEKEKEKQKDEKSDGKDKKKEKLGGLIFMCSKKTKPDCFHYRVMGVTTTKKDVVLGIKPGLTLFLYDFDLKLLYGIYKASSSGAMKLEPKAFAGAFPVQVRFKVHIDCLPLPESTFKIAIKENYDNKNKFKIELTPKQVRKLTELFRPTSLHSSMLPLPNSRVPKVHERETPRGSRELKRERHHHANDSSKSYPTSSHERNQPVAYRDVGYLHRDETPRDLYMSEKEYRTYGLRGERKEPIPVRHDSSLEPYLRGQEGRGRHLMTHQDPIYDPIPFARQPNPVDPIYLTEREYRTHDSGVARHELRSRVSPINASATALDSYSMDPYGTYYNRASLESYAPPPRREEFVSSISSMGSRESYLQSADPRSEIDRVDRVYSRYATDALSSYNEEHHYRAARPEQAPAPVSSRYSFAGPSLSYR